MSGKKLSDDQNLHDPDLNDQNCDDPNDRLSLHDWYDNSVGLERATDTNRNENRRNTFEEQTAVGLTRLVMQGMPMDGEFDEPDNAAMTQTITNATQDPDLQLTDDQLQIFNQIGDNMNKVTAGYDDDERFKDILIRIRNYIKKHGDVSKENPGGDMRKVIYSGISLLFGQIRNVLGRQQDFTPTNAVHLFLSLREVFATIRRQNTLQPEGSQMSVRSLVMEFIRVLWHKFVEFLKNTELGKWVTTYIWKKLLFTRTNMMKAAVVAAGAAYLYWKYWDKNGAS